jgi:hypothetical protein
MADPIEGLQLAQPGLPGPAQPSPEPEPFRIPMSYWDEHRPGPDQTVKAGMQILQQALNGLQGLLEPEERGNPAIPEMQLPQGSWQGRP